MSRNNRRVSGNTIGCLPLLIGLLSIVAVVLVFAIIFSAFVLKEVARAGEWLAVVVAFIGAVFVIRPGIDMMASFPAIVGMLSGCFAGLA